MILLLLILILPLRPDPTLTPGQTVQVILSDLCTPGYSKTVRNVSSATKRDVFTRYDIQPSGAFEVDHLISLELGGSNAVENLWPQSYTTQWNAHQKDALENRLHWLVCHGQLDLAEAQRSLVTDWIAAYDRYITHGPPKGK